MSGETPEDFSEFHDRFIARTRLAGFAVARRRILRDPQAVARARAQGWSAERPYADYLGGFLRRPPKP